MTNPTMTERFRSFLERNKIFFDVAAAVLLGGAALVVSWAALRVNERILSATEISGLPHFSLGKRPRLDPANGHLVEETLVLSNNGGPVSNLRWAVNTFLVVRLMGKERKDIYIPFNGYYFAQFPTSSVTGELSSIVGHENILKFMRLYRAALERNSTAPASDFMFLELATVSSVQFEDRFGRRDVTFFRDYSKVADNDVRQLLAFAAKSTALDIDRITFADIVERARGKDVFVVQALRP